MKRILSFILLVCLVLGLCLPASAENAAPETYTSADGYTYILKEDGSAEITGYTGGEKALAIPADLDGHAVTSIGTRAFYGNKALTEAVVPDTVKVLGIQCFGHCEKLKSVTLPEGLESILTFTFDSCRKLSSVNIPDSVTQINEGLFLECASLKEVALSPDHPLLELVDGVLFKKTSSTLLWYPASRKGKEYEVPDGTKRIGAYAFSESKLERIVLPGSVEELPESAFGNCLKLKAVNIPPKVTSADGAFKNCDKLESIEVDEGNETLESVDGVLFDKTAHALLKFPAARKDKEYEVPEGTEAIMNNAFEQAMLTGITIPGSVRFIASNAFLMCYRLKEVTIPEGVEEFGNYPFQWCYGMVKVSLPASLAKVAQNPFQNCEKLAEIVLAEGNTALELVNGCLVRKEDMALVSCPPGMKAKALEFPAGIRKVGSYAFSSCKSVEEISFADGLEEIADKAFNLCKKLKRVTIPASVTSIDPSAFDTKDLKKTVFVVTAGSYAEEFCTSRGLNVGYAE